MSGHTFCRGVPLGTRRCGAHEALRIVHAQTRDGRHSLPEDIQANLTRLEKALKGLAALEGPPCVAGQKRKAPGADADHDHDHEDAMAAELAGGKAGGKQKKSKKEGRKKKEGNKPGTL